MTGADKSFKKYGKKVAPTEQEFEWGRTRWFITPAFGEHRVISVGEIDLFPGCQQSEHYHYAEEQLIYVIEGNCIHYINGHAYSLGAGALLHIPPHSFHKMKNKEDTIARMLAVFYPVVPEKVKKFRPQPGPEKINWGEIAAKFKAMQRAILSLTGFTAGLLLPDGKELITVTGWPLFCQTFQKDPKGKKECRSSLVKGVKDAVLNRTFQLKRCCCDLVFAAIPIILNNECVAVVICGHVPVGPGRGTPPLDKIKKKAERFNLDEQELSAKFRGIRPAARIKVHIAAESLADQVKNELENYQRLQREIAINRKQEELFYETQKRVKLESDLRAAEIKLLQSQINPHFLYNSLHSIAGMALLEVAKKTYDLILALSSLLRYNLGKEKTLVNVTRLFDYLENYLFIYKMRHGEEFSYNLECHGDARNAMVPFMSVQPIVENAIVHGLEPKIGKKFIKIKLVKEGPFLKITVFDNGVGMSRKEIEQVLDPNRANEDGKAKLGISSLHKRLSHFFGDRYTLTIESEEGKGTEVCIKIPFIIQEMKGGPLDADNDC